MSPILFLSVVHLHIYGRRFYLFLLAIVNERQAHFACTQACCQLNAPRPNAYDPIFDVWLMLPSFSIVNFDRIGRQCIHTHMYAYTFRAGTELATIAHLGNTRAHDAIDFRSTNFNLDSSIYYNKFVIFAYWRMEKGSPTQQPRKIWRSRSNIHSHTLE